MITLPQLPAYEAALTYRDLVRLEAPTIRQRIGDAETLRKYDRYLSTYLRPAPWRQFTDHNWAQKLVAPLDLIRRSEVRTVLDGACGNGFEALLFALHGKTVQANDCASSRTAIATIRRDFYSEVLGAAVSMNISLGNILSGAARLARYDVVFVQEAISHIHPAEEFITLAATRYLQPGGRLLISDSNAWNPVTRARIARHLWQTQRTLKPYVIELTDPTTGEKFLIAEERLFNPLKISRLMRKAGLRVESLYMSGFVWPWMVARLGGTARRIDSWSGSVPGLRLVGGFYTAIGRSQL